MKIFSKKNGLFFSLFPLFLFLTLRISSVQADSPGIQKTEKSQTKPSLRVQKLQSSNQIPIKDQSQEQENDLREFFDVKITDVFLAIFTGCLVWVGYRQIHRLKDTIDQMKRTEERQLRAYLGVRKAWIEDYFAIKPPFKILSIKIELENFGLTPAKDVSLESLIFHSRFPLEDSNLQSEKLKKIFEKITVMPRGEMKPILHFEISPTEIIPLLSHGESDSEVPRGPEGFESVFLIGNFDTKIIWRKFKKLNFFFILIFMLPFQLFFLKKGLSNGNQWHIILRVIKLHERLSGTQERNGK